MLSYQTKEMVLRAVGRHPEPVRFRADGRSRWVSLEQRGLVELTGHHEAVATDKALKEYGNVK